LIAILGLRPLISQPAVKLGTFECPASIPMNTYLTPANQPFQLSDRHTQISRSLLSAHRKGEFLGHDPTPSLTATIWQLSFGFIYTSLEATRFLTVVMA
jgi:hypothetical protein